MIPCPSCGASMPATFPSCTVCGASLSSAVLSSDPPPPRPPTTPPTPPPTAERTEPWFAIAPEDAGTGPQRKRRRTGRVMAAGAGVVAIVIVAGLAWQGLTGRGAGADSPEGAVRGLADAIVDADAAGAIAMIDPNEVGPTTRYWDDLVAYAQEEDSGGATPDDALAEASVTIDGLELETEMLRDDVARVNITGGTFSQAGLEAAGLPETGWSDDDGASYDDEDTWYDEAPTDDDAEQDDEGEQYESSISADELADEMRESFDADSDFEHLFLIATKRDGRWFVSALYTYAEYGRMAAGLDAPDWANVERDGDGAPSASDSVEVMAEAIASADANRMISAMPVESLQVLYDYRSLITDGLSGEYADFQAEWDQAITIREQEYREEAIDDSLTKVYVDRLSFDVDFDYEDYGFTGTIEIEGRCASAVGESRSVDIDWVTPGESTAYPFRAWTGEVVIDESGEYTYFGDDYDGGLIDAKNRVVATDRGTTVMTDAPLPWRDDAGVEVVDAWGREATEVDSYGDTVSVLEDVDSVFDAQGDEIWEHGYPVETDYEEVRTPVVESIDEQSCLSDEDARDAGIGDAFYVVSVREGDEWFVSPIDTAFEYGISALRAQHTS